MKTAKRTGGRGRPPVYDWDTLLKKKRFQMVRGVDYQCSTHIISQQIRNAASKRGVRIELSDYQDVVTVIVTGRMEPVCPTVWQRRADQLLASLVEIYGGRATGEEERDK